MARTDAQVLIARGEKQGRKEGRREMLKAQLEHKFGPLSEATLAAIEALTEIQVNDLGKRILSAQTLQELKL